MFKTFFDFDPFDSIVELALPTHNMTLANSFAGSYNFTIIQQVPKNETINVTLLNFDVIIKDSRERNQVKEVDPVDYDPNAGSAASMIAST